MRGGDFRDFARFERELAAGQDRFGNPADPEWREVFSGPVSLRETPGREQISAGRLEAPVTATLRIRASASSPARSLTSADRAWVRGHVWAIRNGPLDPDGRGQMIEFLLERGGAVQ